MYAYLIIMIAGFFLLGYFLLRRLRGVSYRHFSLEDLPSGGNRGVLFCGSQDDLDILQKAGLRCETVGPSSVLTDTGFSALFAVSANTAYNLQLSRKMRLLSSDIPIIARCGREDLRECFELINVNRILMPGESLNSIASEYRRIS